MTRHANRQQRLLRLLLRRRLSLRSLRADHDQAEPESSRPHGCGQPRDDSSAHHGPPPSSEPGNSHHSFVTDPRPDGSVNSAVKASASTRAAIPATKPARTALTHTRRTWAGEPGRRGRRNQVTECDQLTTSGGAPPFGAVFGLRRRFSIGSRSGRSGRVHSRRSAPVAILGRSFHGYPDGVYPVGRRYVIGG